MKHGIEFFVDEMTNAERILRIAKQIVERFPNEPEVSDFIKVAASIEPVSAGDLARLGSILFGFDSDDVRTTAMEMANDACEVCRTTDKWLICPTRG